MRRLPRDQRLKAEFPALKEQEISELIERFKEVEAIALHIAEQAVAGQMTEDEGRAKLKKECPMLSEELLASTFSQAFYFTCK